MIGRGLAYPHLSRFVLLCDFACHPNTNHDLQHLCALPGLARSEQDICWSTITIWVVLSSPKNAMALGALYNAQTFCCNLDCMKYIDTAYRMVCLFWLRHRWFVSNTLKFVNGLKSSFLPTFLPSITVGESCGPKQREYIPGALSQAEPAQAPCNRCDDCQSPVNKREASHLITIGIHRGNMRPYEGPGVHFQALYSLYRVPLYKALYIGSTKPLYSLWYTSSFCNVFTSRLNAAISIVHLTCQRLSDNNAFPP